MRSIAKDISLLIYGLVFFMSCNSDGPQNPIVGTWIMKATTTQNCKDTSQNIAVSYFCDDLSCRKYIFADDGALKVEHFSKGATTSTEGTYTVSNTTVFIHINELPNTSPVRTFTFTLSGSTLYLKEIITDLSGRCSDTTVLSKYGLQ
jgi:hypothetical protein